MLQQQYIPQHYLLSTAKINISLSAAMSLDLKTQIWKVSYMPSTQSSQFYSHAFHYPNTLQERSFLFSFKLISKHVDVSISWKHIPSSIFMTTLVQTSGFCINI